MLGKHTQNPKNNVTNRSLQKKRSLVRTKNFPPTPPTHTFSLLSEGTRAEITIKKPLLLAYIIRVLLLLLLMLCE